MRKYCVYSIEGQSGTEHDPLLTEVRAAFESNGSKLNCAVSKLLVQSRGPTVFRPLGLKTKQPGLKLQVTHLHRITASHLLRKERCETTLGKHSNSYSVGLTPRHHSYCSQRGNMKVMQISTILISGSVKNGKE